MKLTRKRLMEVAGLRNPLNEVGMDDPKFKAKAAELLDAMEIDMDDNYEGDFNNWYENGMSQPSEEVGDLTGELIDLSSDEEVDKWMDKVALPDLGGTKYTKMKAPQAPQSNLVSKFPNYYQEAVDAEDAMYIWATAVGDNKYTLTDAYQLAYQLFTPLNMFIPAAVDKGNGTLGRYGFDVANPADGATADDHKQNTWGIKGKDGKPLVEFQYDFQYGSGQFDMTSTKSFGHGLNKTFSEGASARGLYNLLDKIMVQYFAKSEKPLITPPPIVGRKIKPDVKYNGAKLKKAEDRQEWLYPLEK